MSPHCPPLLSTTMHAIQKINNKHIHITINTIKEHKTIKESTKNKNQKTTIKHIKN